MNCIIIDDEPLARKGLEKFIGEIPFLNLTDSCSSAMQAIGILSRNDTDLIFLDIEMPKITGIDLLKTTPNLPNVIIITGFPDYAIVGYEFNVLDYLVKPLSFERFLKAVSKAKEFYELQKKAKTTSNNTEEFFFVKCEGRFEKICFNEVLFIEALQNYVTIHLETKKLITYLTIKNMEEQLPERSFIKINKSYIVSIQKIDSIEGDQVIVGKHAFRIGRGNKDEILRKIFNDKLIKRIKTDN